MFSPDGYSAVRVNVFYSLDVSVQLWVTVQVGCTAPLQVDSGITKVIIMRKNHYYVSLEHKSSHKQNSYICSNNQQYIVWLKMIHSSLMPKIIRILNKDDVPGRYPTVNISKRNF